LDISGEFFTLFPAHYPVDYITGVGTVFPVELQRTGGILEIEVSALLADESFVIKIFDLNANR